MFRPNMLKAVVTADVRRFTRGMKKVELASAKAAGKSKAEMAKMSEGMDKVGVAAAAASTIAVAAIGAIIAAMFKLNKSAIAAAKSYETLGLAFQFSYESAAKANKEFGELVKFADATPFDTEQLARYSIQLRNVTSGFIGATKDIKLMSGALAKAQLLGKDQAFINSLGRIIIAFQTGGGQIKRYVNTLLNTGAITADTAIKIKQLSEAGAGAAEVWKVLTSEFNKSRLAAYQFSQTAEGLESTLKSKKTLTLGSLAGEEGLANYKLILGEINTLMTSIRDTDAFKELGESLALLNAEMLETIKGDDFKLFLLDIMVITKHIANAISLIVKGLGYASTVGRVLAGVSTLGGSELARAGYGMDSIFNSTGSADLAKMKRSAANEQTEAIKQLIPPTQAIGNSHRPDLIPEPS